MPYVLNPYVCASSKKKPLYGDEQQTYYIWCECYTNKKHWEGLKEKTKQNKKHILEPVIFQVEMTKNMLDTISETAMQ